MSNRQGLETPSTEHVSIEQLTLPKEESARDFVLAVLKSFDVGERVHYTVRDSHDKLLFRGTGPIVGLGQNRHGVVLRIQGEARIDNVGIDPSRLDGDIDVELRASPKEALIFERSHETMRVYLRSTD